MKINKIFIPIYIVTLFAAGIFAGKLLNYTIEPLSNNTKNHKNKLNKLIDFINNDYVNKVNTDSIVDNTVDNILAKLDPHSVYLPPSEQSEETEIMQGNFVGIGISFYILNDSLAVISTIENGPAARAGIVAGDRILYADKSKLFGNKITDKYLFSKLKGKENSEIELTIFRKKIHKSFKLKLLRTTIPIKSINASIMINKITGYIKIDRFAETTFDEFKTAETKLIQQGAQNLVIDLRDNGGGFLEIATQIADEFLKKNQLIVFTKNNKGEITKTYATDEGDFENGKIDILINENSASASEILAGAIQDNDRGRVIGRRSFGKGLVQREMNFDDGSAVRLTIAKYFTPCGRCIQKPFNKGTENYYNEFDERLANGELYHKENIKHNDSLRFKTKNGKIVYGGGGIVPDIFVPMEGKQGDESLNYLLESGFINHFVFEDLENNYPLKNNINFNQLIENKKLMENYFNKFQKYIAKSGLEINLMRNQKSVQLHLKAELAKQLIGDTKYFDLITKNDAMIKVVLK